MFGIYYFANYSQSSQDGGTSRDNAFFSFIKQIPSIKIINVYTANAFKRVIMWCRCSLWLLLSRQKTLLIHQNSILTLYSGKLLSNKIYREIIFKILQRAARNNRMIIEVNDLRYEQAQDLNLPYDSGFFTLQNAMLRLPNAEFIFASYKMREYAIENFELTKYKTYVIINGGILLDKAATNAVLPPDFIQIYDAKKINYVYAGSLIPGRKIAALLEIFAKFGNCSLYLLGVDGDWLLQEQLSDNIHYLGSLSEELAYLVVEKCDLGLIPYDDSKFYYNLCFPTKASLYIAAGIPFMSTRLDELIYNFGDRGVAEFCSLEDWEIRVAGFTKESLQTYRQRVGNIRDVYTWNNLLMPLTSILYQ